MSRERYARPARTNGSSTSSIVHVCSAAADEVDDLDAVAVGERGAAYVAARHDVAVHLDRDAASAETERREQLGDA